MRAFLACVVLAALLLTGCAASTATVRVPTKELGACRTKISASLDMSNPNKAIPDANGVTWVQITNGFEVRAPEDIMIISGVIKNPSRQAPMSTPFIVQEPNYGRTVRFTYADFPMANHGELCITQR